MSSPFEQLFDISPFPAVISRLRDNSVIAINKRNSETFGISQADAVGQTTTNYYADVSHRERPSRPLEATGRADNVLLHLRKPSGETFWARASARMITWENEPAVLTVIEDISQQLSAQRALEDSEQRLAKQSAALTALTASHADPNDTFEHRLRRIHEMAAATLDAERVSLWRFGDHQSSIICVGLYRRTENPARVRRCPRTRCGALVFRGHRARAGHCRGRRSNRSAHARIPHVVSRAAQYPRDARCSAEARPGRDRRAVRRTRRRATLVDDRRAKLRDLHREPDRHRNRR
jgi:PAS domain S-box-containing protein